MARSKSTASPANSTATIGFEAKLWITADKLRNNMDAAEPSGANRVERDSLHEVQPARAGAAAHGKQPAAGSPKGQRGGAEQYKAENVFWVPADARWSHLQANAKQPEGKAEVRMQKEEPRLQLPTSSFSLQTWPDAMVAIERDNPRLKGVLPKDYARPGSGSYLPEEARTTVRQFRIVQIGRSPNP
jgi:type I restriction enzyme M protein